MKSHLVYMLLPNRNYYDTKWTAISNIYDSRQLFYRLLWYISVTTNSMLFRLIPLCFNYQPSELLAIGYYHNMTCLLVTYFLSKTNLSRG